MTILKDGGAILSEAKAWNSCARDGVTRKKLGLKSGGPGLLPALTFTHSPAVWPRAGHFPSLNLSFLECTVGEDVHLLALTPGFRETHHTEGLSPKAVLRDGFLSLPPHRDVSPGHTLSKQRASPGAKITEREPGVSGTQSPAQLFKAAQQRPSGCPQPEPG